jgi:hypothetical protein
MIDNARDEEDKALAAFDALDAALERGDLDRVLDLFVENDDVTFWGRPRRSVPLAARNCVGC